MSSIDEAKISSGFIKGLLKFSRYPEGTGVAWKTTMILVHTIGDSRGVREASLSNFLANRQEDPTIPDSYG